MKGSVKYIQENWRPLSSIALLAVGIGMGIAGLSQAIAAVAAATLSLVLMVWHLQQRTSTPTVVPGGMQDAKAEVFAAMRRLSRKKNSKKPLSVRVVGYRLRDIRSVFDTLEETSLHNIRFEILHIDPVFLESEPWPNASKDAVDVKQSLTRMQALAPALQRRGITVLFYPYRHRPVVWAYAIGQRFVAWGPFTWEHEESTYKGPRNPALILQAGDPAFDEVYEWIDSLCAEWIEYRANELNQPPSIPAVAADG